MQLSRFPKNVLLILELLINMFKIPNLVNKYKTIFLGKQGSLWNFAKIFSPCWNFLWTCSKVCQIPKLNLLCSWMLIKGSKKQNLLDEYKNHFFGKTRQTLKIPENFTYIGVSYNFVLTSAQSINWIFWVIEYWFNAL